MNMSIGIERPESRAKSRVTVGLAGRYDLDMKKHLIVGLLCAAGCAALHAEDVADPTTRPFVVGRLEAEAIKESSGIVASRKHPGVFWTHNDSGNPPVLYAVRRDGSLINAFPTKCVAFDWEDIAIDDEGHLYLGDIGNNGNLRGSIGVLKFDEPDPNVAPEKGKALEPTQRWTLTFQNSKRMDCESLFVWEGHGYVIKKTTDRSPTTLWRFSLSKDGAQPLEAVATLPLAAICTAADLSADGEQLAVMSTNGPYLFKDLKGDLANVANRVPTSIQIEPRTNEALCFAEDGLIGTSEARDVYFFPFSSFERSDTQPAK